MNKAEKMGRIGELYAEFHQLHEEFGKIWLEETFLHWDWWISLALGTGSWIFWVFYRKKESTHRLLYAGVTVMFISVVLDYAGTALGLWYYSGKLSPSFPAWIPFNFGVLPVAIMFLIQTKPHIAAWKKGILFGLLTGIVGEPIFKWTGFYVLTGWHYSYSVPIYALIFIFADWLTKRNDFSRV